MEWKEKERRKQTAYRRGVDREGWGGKIGQGKEGCTSFSHFQHGDKEQHFCIGLLDNNSKFRRHNDLSQVVDHQLLAYISDERSNGSGCLQESQSLHWCIVAARRTSPPADNTWHTHNRSAWSSAAVPMFRRAHMLFVSDGTKQTIVIAANCVGKLHGFQIITIN